ncbi:hypothetical protein [Weissella confusa]|uniref:hypothetical protein n=1 Tax=Weissella confusa TaxID=1583 RepID=UPI002F268C6D
MKTVKILGDTLNKVADTSTVFNFRLWNEGQAQDVTGKAVSFVIANDSGYLFDVPAVVDGNVVSLDFSNELLKQLTPDTYYMEVSFTNEDGDVEVYPSDGTITFKVGKNLHGTQGKLVPQITFDTVLASVDEKINEYTKTITKGDKGDTGPQGPKGDMDLSQIKVGGRNLYLNSKVLADNYAQNSSSVTVEPFDSTTNMWHIVSAQGNGGGVGIFLWDYANGKIPNNSDWSYSVDMKGVGNISSFGIEGSDRNPLKGTIGSEWSRISQTGHVNSPQYKTIVMYFDTTNSPLDVYIKLPKLETGNMPTDWTPAPEDADNTFLKKANQLPAEARDFNYLATHTQTYQGTWWNGSDNVLNAPQSDWTWSIIKIVAGGYGNAGMITTTKLYKNDIYLSNVVSGSINGWQLIANDANVVHTTTNETISGDNALVGNTTLATTTILAGNYGLRVTSSGFQKTTDGKTWVAANI